MHGTGLQVLSQDQAKEALTMNNGYFFGLLDRMISGALCASRCSRHYSNHGSRRHCQHHL